MRILTVMWSSYLPLLSEAARSLGIELSAWSTKQIKRESGSIARIAGEMGKVDLVLLYRTSDDFWEELEQAVLEAKDRIPVIVVGPEPSFSALSNVNPEMTSAVYRYILFGGATNMRNMLAYLVSQLFGGTATFDSPEPLPWQGIHHPAIPDVFSSTADFLSAYRTYLPFEPTSYVGLLYSRSNWVNRNLEVESAIIHALEDRNLGVIPVFYYSLKDANLGNMGGSEAVEHFLMKGRDPLVDAVVKLTAFFLSSERGGIKESDAPSGVETLKGLGVPVFAPVISYYKDRTQWLEDPEGLGSQTAWSIAMPEFEGVIEPIVVGASKGISTPEEESYEALDDRIEKLAGRIARWVGLRRKPNCEKKVAFILNNNPCAGVEATVGGGAHLDTLESVVDIMKRMAAEGYEVTPPENGKALIDEIMARKAISEFRWTTVEEIVHKGGVLALVENDHYVEWFEEMPEATRERITGAWGDPPGEEKDGIPAAMVYDGKILVTGLRFGNAVVCVQPKRGCAGARCDGQVCKILHDPSVPPPHQYIATYKWLSREFGADAIVHVGTHGNLEFLPGKATGLTSGCLPDIAIDTMPHLYIYNADNPPEGTIAKRRSNAVLVDHMQTVMVKGELYGDLDELGRLLAEYTRYQHTEPGKAHTISHMIMDRVKNLNLIPSDRLSHELMDETIVEIHEKLSLLKGTYIPKGMHVFGKVPQGADQAELIYAIMRYESSPGSLRAIVTDVMGRESPGLNGETGEAVEALARSLCKAWVENGTSLVDGVSAEYTLLSEERGAFAKIEDELAHIDRLISASDEMAALLSGFNASYIAPGPSGLITRGRPDILPTGRNFYSLDPQTIPTKAAWEVGKMLADRTLDRYLIDEGDYPENIAFYWQCTDIMWSDGEGMAQMMYLMGVKPVWQENGKVRSFVVMPPDELGRPRIDITVRVSGITRDNFSGAIELLDEAIQTVAALPEPVERNFVRKHTLEKLDDRPETDKAALRQATYRLFASMPGTYQAGTQLAVYASAWKTDRDLADVFLYWNGYAYGKGVFGEA
ncbi:MAG TPA: cobaltochelatase subunit CobN, partial [Syntrophorhabdales bacterium]|nr:cobaltochelatase subunit CobN [Syntrophorhabdales bacterium]